MVSRWVTVANVSHYQTLSQTHLLRTTVVITIGEFSLVEPPNN